MTWRTYDPFPASALGKVLGPAVLQHHCNSQLSIELIAPIALGLAAAAIQDLYDVQRPNMPPCPTSLFVAPIATTGEGKDAAAAPWLRPFLEFQAAADLEYEEQRRAFEVDMQEWRVAEKILLGELEKCIRGDDNVDEVKERLSIHANDRPRQPRAPLIVYDDATVSAIKQSLCERWRSGVLVSMEGSDMFNGRLGSAFPFWNAVWGGAPIFSDRVAEGRRSAHDARISVVVGIQPVPFQRFLNRRGVEAHDSGFTARYLLAVPPSTKGNRLIGSWRVCTDAIETYVVRVRELLDIAGKSTAAGQRRRVLRLSPGAAELFVGIYNRLQIMMAPGQPYFEISGQAAKAAENVARVAAVLHVLDALDGDISEDTLMRAATIVEWFVNQFLMLFAACTGKQTPEHYAGAVEQALIRARERGHSAVLRSELKYWCSPDVFGTRLDRGLRDLISTGRAFFIRHKGKVFVTLPSPWDTLRLSAT